MVTVIGDDLNVKRSLNSWRFAMNRYIASMILALSVLLVASGSAHAISIGAAATALGATVDPGLAPSGTFGTVIVADGTGLQTTPLDGLADYSFTQPSPMGLAAGNTTDFHWVHETSGAFAAPGAGTMWAFGGASATDFILFPSIDHGPVVEESLETTLYGSSDGGTTWALGTITTLYALGFSAASPDDDTAFRWVFPSAVSLISATAGLAQGTYSFASFDTEIDAIAIASTPIPEPGTLSLMGIGLGVLAFSVWRKRERAAASKNP